MSAAANQIRSFRAIKKWTALALLIFVGLAGAGCTRVKPVVKIGLVAPFEGRNRDIGYDVIYAARLAIREANARGDLEPYRIALVALDDNGSPDLATEAAAAIAADSDIVAVIGHWLPDTSVAGGLVYAENDLAMVAAGGAPIGTFSEKALPEDFIQAYEAITPFDETAGPYAGTAYDAVNLIIDAIRVTIDANEEPDRGSLYIQLKDHRYSGITGTLYVP